MKFISANRYLIGLLVALGLLSLIGILDVLDSYTLVSLDDPSDTTNAISDRIERNIIFSLSIVVLSIVFFISAFLALRHEDLQRHRAEKELKLVNASLESQVQQRTKELTRANLSLRNAYDETIEGWSKALDLRDQETEGHSQRVTEMTLRLAKMAGMSDEELIHVHRGALLHDIGKIGIPDQILHKPDKLTDEEWTIMQTHPQIGYALLYPIEYLHPALDIPYCHHEKWNGSGYPRGLKGEEIPLAARLFAVVDVWDALRSDRPYRKAWSDTEVLDHISTLSGTHLDSKAVVYFFKVESVL